MEKPDQLNAANASGGVPVPPATAESSDQEIRQLKAEISENQAQLHETVAEIQERLSPTHLKEQATTAVRDATVGRVENMMNRAGETAGQMRRTTRRAAEQVTSDIGSNPLPYALIALGAAWLLVNRQSPRRWDSDEDEDGRTAFDSSDYSSPVAGPSSSSNRRGASVGRWQTDARNRARDVASTARRRFETMLNENPLVLGVAAMATGALVAAAFPTTDVEERYMGEASETLVESAKEATQGAVEKVTGSSSQPPA